MLEAQQDDCAIWMNDPVKRVALYLGGFSLKIGKIADGLDSYLLKYTVQFEIFFNNGFKNTRIGTIPYSKFTTLIETSKKPSYVLTTETEIDVEHELYKAVTGGWEPTSWSGFQFSGKEGNRDSFFFVKKGYKFKIGIRPTICYTAVGFSDISLVYNNPQFRFTFEGVIHYKEMTKTSIMANDGLSIEIENASNFSIKENTNDISGEMPNLEMSFVGKVRQSSISFREGKLQSLPSGVLVLNNGDYRTDGYNPYSRGGKYRTPIVLLISKKFDDGTGFSFENFVTDPVVNGFKYKGNYYMTDLSKYCPYKNPIVVSVCQRGRLHTETMADSGGDNWVQGQSFEGVAGDFLYVNESIRDDEKYEIEEPYILIC
jgi:hypothetical protein